MVIAVTRNRCLKTANLIMCFHDLIRIISQVLDNHFLIIRKGGRGKLGGTEGVREREFVAYNKYSGFYTNFAGVKSSHELL